MVQLNYVKNGLNYLKLIHNNCPIGLILQSFYTTCLCGENQESDQNPDQGEAREEAGVRYQARAGSGSMAMF